MAKPLSLGQTQATLVLAMVAAGAVCACAATFDGKTTLVEIPPSVSADLGGASTVTVSAWIALDRTASGRRNEVLDLTIATTFSKITLGFDSSNRLRAGGRTDATEEFQSVQLAQSWASDEMRYVAAVFDASGSEIRLYVDGVRQEAIGKPKWSGTVFSHDTGSAGTIGMTAGGSHPFKGQIQDVRLYARGLSEKEIRALFEAARTDQPNEGLIGRWLYRAGQVPSTLAGAMPRGEVDDIRMVRLAGSPAEIGAHWGRINAPHIQSALAGYVERAKSAGLSEEELWRRAQPFLTIVGEIAPHWIEEARAAGQAAEVDGDCYLSFLANAPRSIGFSDEMPEHECTSYAAAPAVTAEGRVFFHRTRDNTPMPQAVAILRSTVPGVNKFVTGVYAHSIWPSFMINERGLIASADMSGKDANPRFRGLMNGAMLRHIAERAGSCDEALELIRTYLEKGWYAGGGQGTRWTILDRTGRILDVQHAAAANTLKFAYVATPTHITWPDRAAAGRLKSAAAPISFLDFRNIYRDESILVKSSILGVTVSMDPEFPELLTAMWVSLPARGLAFPLYMGCEATPEPLLDGTVYEICRQVTGEAARWEQVEKALFRNSTLMEAEARRLIAVGEEAAARALMESWVAETVSAPMRLLELAVSVN